ncbi:spermidine synthase [Methylopila capsulata]|uniref:Spermidine synthase n=1 Tax=Methylopila capsulata TaxID=61654 RepID=A0ABS2T5N1_9HYPH|nr:spermidine synthase [Methylopila capsulata]MBM7851495.1 spermidine synthase [Methylopila capsulata]
MIPWIHLDTAQAPGGGGVLKLARRGDEFSIRIGQIELMNSRLSGSEKALATLACERIRDRVRPRVLIGGLGMGFTLGAALGALPAGASVVVAELVPAVVAWARGPMSEIFGTSLGDPRVTIVQDDVAAVMRADRGGYDAILLDVDNGPEALTQASNDGLYGLEGLGDARAALKGGGVLAVWSQGPDKSFGARLFKSGFKVEGHRVRAHRAGKGGRHVIWLAMKAQAGPPGAGKPKPRARPSRAGGRPSAF